MYRITIEDLEHPEYGPQTLEYAHLSMEEERSLDTSPRTSAVELVPNGYQRACIRLWAIGNSYYDFPTGRNFGARRHGMTEEK